MLITKKLLYPTVLEIEKKVDWKNEEIEKGIFLYRKATIQNGILQNFGSPQEGANWLK